MEGADGLLVGREVGVELLGAGEGFGWEELGETVRLVEELLNV